MEYQPERYGSEWIDEDLEKKDKVLIYRVFHFLHKHLVNGKKREIDSFDSRRFVIGELEGGYYKIDKDILGLKYDLLLDKGMKITEKTFIAAGHISIFRKIDQLSDEQIVVGGNRKNAIPVIDFEMLCKSFPTETTLSHYARSRISELLKDYLETIIDAQKKFNDHLKRQNKIKAKSRVEFLRMYEVEKYRYIHDSLVEMLKDSDSYDEDKWQEQMVAFLLLLFPKYVAVLNNVYIKDFYVNPAKPTNRFIDLTLVDANGNIDIIEIKKPFTNCLLSTGKYRDNYTPRKELSGAVMQAEKYLFHLNKWGVEGEKTINKKRASELPKGMQIRITNPQAMIVIGRDNDFKNDQKFDFEIIKRKYSNIIDIMTYDDLLQRLNNIIAKFDTLALPDVLIG